MKLAITSISLFCVAALWITVACAAGHVPAHGGSLNVIGHEEGHLELRIRDGKVEAWFVGGGNDTHRSVRVKADELRLIVHKELVLKAEPMKLAGESEGDCSHFVAEVDWLRPTDTFSADTKVVFKGKETDVHIVYPKGYDPLHGAADNGHHSHETGKEHGE